MTLGPRAESVRQEQPAVLVQLGIKVYLELPVCPELRVALDRQDRQGVQDLREVLEIQDLLEQQDCQVVEVRRVWWALLVQLEIPE